MMMHFQTCIIAFVMQAMSGFMYKRYCHRFSHNKQYLATNLSISGFLISYASTGPCRLQTHIPEVSRPQSLKKVLLL